MSTATSPFEPIADDAFVGRVVALASAAGPLRLGIVDPFAHAVAEGVSRLLMRSIQDAREENAGHLPSWLVDDIERNYISPAKVRTLWAPKGHRFALVLDREIVGTVHVAREHDNIFTIDRHQINVSAGAHPGFKPEGFHHVVNLSVKHELRRLKLGTLMIDAIIEHFRDAFDGIGLWVRADPPWHAGLVGLGFEHDPSMDVFLPASAVKTAGLEHRAFNLLHACNCRPTSPQKPDTLAERDASMAAQKLQYVSFTRRFDGVRGTRAHPPSALTFDEEAATRERYASDWGLVARKLPRAIAMPASAEETAAVLAYASSTQRRVVVRGAGCSAAGQSLGDDIVLSTERLLGVSDAGASGIHVMGGTPWADVLDALATRGRCPRVIPGFLAATVGGTIASGGYSKGSAVRGLVSDHIRSLLVATGDGRLVECSERQAAWLFRAVLGGLGQFGVVVRATLETRPSPPLLRVVRQDVSRTALAMLLVDAAAAFHVTAFAQEDRFTVVVAREDDGAEGEPTAFERYVRPHRPSAPGGASTWLHLFTSTGTLSDVLDVLAPALDLANGDALQVLPIRRLRGLESLVHDAPSNDELRCAVNITREVRGRSIALLEAENERLAVAAYARGATSQCAGALPRSPEAWRASLGSAYDALVRIKRIADPNDVLTTPAIPWMPRR